MKPNRFSKLAALLASTVLIGLSSHATAATVYASYTGSQQGVTVRNTTLSQLWSFNTGVQINGIAAGPSNNVFLAGGNVLYNYSAGGALLDIMVFPDVNIEYTDIALGGNHVFASYTGSQQGITVRNLNLDQTFSFNIGINISGIAAGPSNNVYVASGNALYNYSATGVLLGVMVFPDSGINYTDVAVLGNRVYASYTGTQRGVTVRDLNLNQLYFFSTNFNIDGITTGGSGDLYLAADNHLYRYTVGGTLLTNMTFPDNHINYTGVAYAP